MNSAVYRPITDARGAWISEDGRFRYALWRCWRPALDPLVFVMCNPSTADADVDDPTIRKCIGFAKALDRGGICVVNLYGLRATDAKTLISVSDAHGAENNRALEAACEVTRGPSDLVVAWGAVARDHGPHYEDQVCHLQVIARGRGKQLVALKITGDGITPGHPLMLSYRLKLKPWIWDDRACRDCARKAR